jgi:hypothetical protein
MRRQLTTQYYQKEIKSGAIRDLPCGFALPGAFPAHIIIVHKSNPGGSAGVSDSRSRSFFL